MTSKTCELIIILQVYQESNRTDKFVKRFLMREILNQMSALQRPIEAASDTLDTQAREER